MAEQIMDYGVAIGFDAYNPTFALISDGYFTIRVYISNGVNLQIGKAYQVYKKGSLYYIGNEVNL